MPVVIDTTELWYYGPSLNPVWNSSFQTKHNLSCYLPLKGATDLDNDSFRTEPETACSRPTATTAKFTLINCKEVAMLVWDGVHMPASNRWNVSVATVAPVSSLRAPAGPTRALRRSLPCVKALGVECRLPAVCCPEQSERNGDSSGFHIWSIHLVCSAGRHWWDHPAKFSV